jgi:uncharacterized protein (TIGR00730 family)
VAEVNTAHLIDPEPDPEADGLATAASPATRANNADLITQIKESADKLAHDQTTRGDLKILSRTLRELRYAFKVFRPYRSKRKVTMFGSARTPPGHPYYEQAVEFGRSMAQLGWLIVTGASSGIMEAGHVGAGRDSSMGINIMLPFEQGSNHIIAGDPKLVHMKYFFTRKLMFVKECDALCLCPGGFGTLDEATEVLTLLQTGKRDLVPVVFLNPPGDDFWDLFQQFITDRLLERGMISPDDLSLYLMTDSVDAAVQEIVGFYRVYHSMRYVRDDLVFRLTQKPSAELVERINQNFADILVEGKFAAGDALREEQDEPALIALPRLVFHFDRRSLGRLRQLVDFINRESPATTPPGIGANHVSVNFKPPAQNGGR